ncbi:MAG: hypothetical protein ACI9ES_000192 [Oceanospirillaceae bacterium]|jgi:hypothetical protein
MISLYELSVGTYKQVLVGAINTMKQGISHFEEQGLDINEMLAMRLTDDMAALPFQVNSVKHHSLGAIHGLLKGEFTAPTPLPEMSYLELVDFLELTLKEINDITAQSINSLYGNAMYFRKGDMEVPFSAERFVLSFSLPNLYFHAATLYNILRVAGVPLSKRDYLGAMNIGLPVGPS